MEHPLAALTPDERALLALEDAVLMAIRRGDPTALAACLTEDFVLLSPDGSQTRREAFVRAATDLPGEVLELSAQHLRAHVIAGVGVLTGLQRARVRLPDGVEVDDLQLFTDVCVRTGTGWRMALVHSGQAVAPPPPG
jgi:ketosteroid isomerase-like protein